MSLMRPSLPLESGFTEESLTEVIKGKIDKIIDVYSVTQKKEITTMEIFIETCNQLSTGAFGSIPSQLVLRVVEEYLLESINRFRNIETQREDLIKYKIKQYVIQFVVEFRQYSPQEELNEIVRLLQTDSELPDITLEEIAKGYSDAKAEMLWDSLRPEDQALLRNK